MSRSYKKHPYIIMGGNSKFGKKFANRRIRNAKQDLPKGGSYKKLYEQYDLKDWIIRWTWEEALEDYHRKPNLYKRFKDEKEFYRYWYKCTKMK